jgi:hypothetical protein
MALDGAPVRPKDDEASQRSSPGLRRPDAGGPGRLPVLPGDPARVPEPRPSSTRPDRPAGRARPSRMTAVRRPGRSAVTACSLSPRLPRTGPLGPATSTAGISRASRRPGTARRRRPVDGECCRTLQQAPASASARVVLPAIDVLSSRRSRSCGRSRRRSRSSPILLVSPASLIAMSVARLRPEARGPRSWRSPSPGAVHTAIGEGPGHCRGALVVARCWHGARSTSCLRSGHRAGSRLSPRWA